MTYVRHGVTVPYKEKHMYIKLLFKNPMVPDCTFAFVYLCEENTSIRLQEIC